ncbi:MAG TPA: hypothetical protein VF756_25090 [Thermoanaerobaculia bacterium]
MQETIVPTHDVQPNAEKRKRPPKPGGGNFGTMQERLKSERVQQMLKALLQRGWKQVQGGWALQRTYELGLGSVARAYSSVALELASFHDQPVELLASGARLTITLPGSPGRSRTLRFTEEMLGFATALP